MKNDRQRRILEIVEREAIDTQEQLQQKLQEQGVTCTQATISRDIKELRLVKELTSSGGYRYALSERKMSSASDTRLRNIFKEGVLSVDVAQNIVVVRTMPGLASAACSALDAMDIDGMVGSLAGDDTGILIMRDNSLAQQFNSEVHKLLR